MPLRETFLPSERVHRLEPDEKKRLDYSVKSIWSFKSQSAIRRAKDWAGAKVNSVTDHKNFEAFQAVCEGNIRAANVLYKENARLLAAGESPLDLESDEVKAFVHYILQTLNKSQFASPRWDDWGQVFYPSNEGRIDLMPGVDIPQALTGLVTNYDAARELFVGKDGARKEQIESILADGNLVIVSNHCTWLNLPLIVSFLHLEVGIPLERINTLLGPALTTYEQGLGVAGISNLIKTVPDTPNGRLDNVAPELQKSIRSASVRQMMQLLKGTGQVLIMSPGGTTDRVTEEAIQLLEASKVTQRLVKSLATKHHVWPIATHTGALFAGHKIRTGRFQFYENGIMDPVPSQEQTKESNPIRQLKYNMRALNPDRSVDVMDEQMYVGE